MNSGDIIVNINNIEDIKNITDKTKYINLNINSVNTDVVDYFIINGKGYSYADSIDGRNGYIYANYDIFAAGESIIDNIIDSIPLGLSDIEKVRYIYIYLGKILCSDINIDETKNKMISFDMISSINNIWSSLCKKRVNDVVISKIFMYLCFRIGITCELISNGIKGNVANKVYIDDSFLIVDLYNDIHNIQGNFSTKCFDKYNKCTELDKKIEYIKNEYMDDCIDKVLNSISYTDDNVVMEILNVTSGFINVGNIGSCELYKIYRNVFDKYASNYDVKVNNLFICSGMDSKEHFIVFNCNNKYYGYNYNKNMFVDIDYSVLYDNINSNKMGVYDNEDFELLEGRVVL